MPKGHGGGQDRIKDRGTALKQGRFEHAKDLNKEIKDQTIRDKMIQTLEMIDEDLDLRDK